MCFRADRRWCPVRTPPPTPRRPPAPRPSGHSAGRDNRVRNPLVAMAKLAPMSVSVGAPVPSFATSCQRVCVPRWKPMPMSGRGRMLAGDCLASRTCQVAHAFCIMAGTSPSPLVCDGPDHRTDSQQRADDRFDIGSLDIALGHERSAGDGQKLVPDRQNCRLQYGVFQFRSQR